METRGAGSKNNATLGKGVAQIVQLYHAEVFRTLAERGIVKKKFKYGVERRVANLDFLSEDRIFSLMKGIEKLTIARESNVRNQFEQRLLSARKMLEILKNDLQKEKSQWLYTRSLFRWLPFSVLVRIKNDIIKVEAIIATLESSLGDLQVTLLISQKPTVSETISELNKKAIKNMEASGKSAASLKITGEMINKSNEKADSTVADSSKL
jgi:hypothetical protein